MAFGGPGGDHHPATPPCQSTPVAGASVSLTAGASGTLHQMLFAGFPPPIQCGPLRAPEQRWPVPAHQLCAQAAPCVVLRHSRFTSHRRHIANEAVLRCIMWYYVVLCFFMQFCDFFAYLLPSCAWLTSPAETCMVIWYTVMTKRLKYNSIASTLMRLNRLVYSLKSTNDPFQYVCRYT